MYTRLKYIPSMTECEVDLEAGVCDEDWMLFCYLSRTRRTEVGAPRCPAPSLLSNDTQTEMICAPGRTESERKSSLIFFAPCVSGGRPP